MTATVAYLEAIVGADITSFRRAMGEVRSSILDVGGLASGMRHLGRDLTYALTVPLLGFGAAALSTFSEFESKMRNIAAISPLIANDFDAISERVRITGESFREGAIGIAEALYEVQSAGFGLNDIDAAMAVAIQAAELSEAGLSQIDVTTRALVSSLLAYGEGADQAAYFSDVLANTVAYGIGSMDALVNSLGSVVGQSYAAGVGFDELGATMAYITQHTAMPFQRTGTALGNMFNKLINPSDALLEIFQEYGAVTGEQFIAQFGTLGDALGELYRITEGREDLVRELFPDDRGFRAALSIFNDMEGYTDLLTDFGLTLDGVTDRARAEQLASFAARVDLLKSAFQSLLITVGGRLADILAPFLKQLTAFVDNLANANPAVLDLAIALGIVAAALPPLMYLIGSITSPIGLLVSGIILFATAIRDNWGGLRDTILDVLSPFEPFLDAARIAMERFLAAFAEPEGEEGTPLERLAYALRTAQPEIETALEELRDIFTVNFDNILAEIDRFGTNLLIQLAGIFRRDKDTGLENPVFELVRSLFSGDIGAEVDNWLTENFPGITTYFTVFFNNLQEWFINTGIPTIAGIFGYVFGVLANAVGDIIQGLFAGKGQENPVAKAFREGLESGFAAAMDDFNVDTIGDQLATLVGAIIVAGFAVTKLFGVGGLVIAALGKGIVLLLTSAIAWAGGFISTLGVALGAVIQGVLLYVGSALTMLGGVGTAILGVAKSLIVGIASAISSLATVAVGVIGAGLLTVLGGVLAGIGVWFILPDETKQAIHDALWGAIADAIGVPDAGQLEQDFANGLQASIANGLAGVMDLFGRGDLAQGLRDLALEAQGFDPSSGFHPDPDLAGGSAGGFGASQKRPLSARKRGSVEDTTNLFDTLTQIIQDGYTQIVLVLQQLSVDTDKYMAAFQMAFVSVLSYLIKESPALFDNFAAIFSSFATQVIKIASEVTNAWMSMLTTLSILPNTEGININLPATTGGGGRGSGGGQYTQNVNITTTSADKLITDLKQRGVDLMAGKRF